MYRFLILAIAAVNLSIGSCGRLSDINYDIDKLSPDGTYRVKVEVRAGGSASAYEKSERVKFQYFKGHEIIQAYDWVNTDPYEPSFRESMPIIEWVDRNVLRMGQDRSDQPYFDEIIVSNYTDETLKYVDVNYGRFETFWIFDSAPQSQLVLRASPRFKPNGTSNSSLSYGGMTQSGKQFKGTLNGKERKSPTEEPLKFHITIHAEDIR
jgi:hypothetical protein